jgi:transposase InsO family protein
MRILGIQSTIKFKSQGCTKSASDPEHVAENILDRQFYAGLPNEKWLTDVTEFKYVLNNEVRKLYLSAILDLCDRRIVAYIIRDHNDNRLVFDTFDAAVSNNPGAHPLFHSDRGFQYTNRVFHGKLVAAGMTQSMSRVGRCIDNGPMEGFWGIIKREFYYGNKFTSHEKLVQAITDYIDYYNNRRYQRRLFTLAPMEVYNQLMAA